MMEKESIWLLRLASAHLLVNFIIQPNSWIEAKRKYHLSTPVFWLHLLIKVMVTGWFIGFEPWWVLMTLFISYGLTDWWRSHQPDGLHRFLLDQTLNTIIIGTIWMVRFPGASLLIHQQHGFFADGKFWLVFASVAFLTKPSGNAIEVLTHGFREKIVDHRNRGLANAGEWIGVLERLIVYFLVLADKFEPIGLLIAAKSIIRMKEGDQKMSEYVLVGSLLSLSISLITGMVTRALLDSYF